MEMFKIIKFLLKTEFHYAACTPIFSMQRRSNNRFEWKFIFSLLLDFEFVDSVWIFE